MMPGPYELNSIIVSDAVNLLRSLESNSVPLIITDPPFGVGYHSNHYKEKNPFAPIANDWNFQIGRFIQESERVLAKGGALYLHSRWDVTPIWVPAISASGLTLKTKIIWMKNNWSAGDLEGSFGNQYEEILFISKGRHRIRGKRWPNIWQFDRIPAKKLLHPTQKPTPLLIRAIEASSDKGDFVVDPFAGSGSTGEAAILTGRNFLLGDIDPKMVNIARRRLNLPPLPSDDDTPDPYRESEYTLEVPSWEYWGIHPEDLQFIRDELQGNIVNLNRQLQPPLFVVQPEQIAMDLA